MICKIDRLSMTVDKKIFVPIFERIRISMKMKVRPNSDDRSVEIDLFRSARSVFLKEMRTLL